ncbi:YgjV family protein [Cellvibrio japonicus]|uniref:Putative membrane protein n=1 Tax=Cellvibrio japonicus (strain Ueda107) TaxID=498211 RepID=B3PBM2_CELJU|nr:YgjV family protein [Cellvibrio japonicus]ACE83733.1 putative membrane protein [Cellvibrio japonicus Ueda107]QEI13135.1 YgjV family protein [Cellvibrio japonicus]QEI16709.1 YgjV family protein [Cellvibrio japonicus]QEI20287.1 YgjV family protein [Cellvibrio japonicus]
MFENPLAQFFGLLSFALGIYCFYQRSDRRLKIIMFVMQFNNCIHFALLGSSTAAFSSLLSVIRTGLSLHTRSRLIAWLFIALSFGLGLWLAERWQDMLPVIGSCIGTYALFCLQGIGMRIAFLIGACFWLSNNIWVGSLGGTLLESTLICVNLRTIYKLYRYGGEN